MSGQLPEINGRIKKLVTEFCDGNVQKFVELTGISSHQVLNRIFSVDSRSGKYPKPSSGILCAIQAKLPQVNYDWLLTGNGDMIKANASILPAVSENTVLLLPISAQGGSLNDFTLSVRASDCERIISPIKSADFAVTVAGDSMSPVYPAGSQVLVKKINEKSFIAWGTVYVLDTCNGVVVKKLLPVKDDEGRVQCVSINPDYPPFTVSLTDVYGIYRVLLCMSIKS